MNAYSGPPITLGNAAAAPCAGNRQRKIDGETQRSVARSYNVSQSTISRLTPCP